MEKQKMTKIEKSWILYDVASSAFSMILTATIPIYFRSLATANGVSATHATSIWGTSTSIAILILALLAPVLGALADYENTKKKIFVFFLCLAIGGGFAFTLAPNWIVFLVFFIVSRIGYSACNILYDSMLIDVTDDEKMDRISSYGYAMGYIGSCIPFILGILLILLKPFGLSTVLATQLSFVITMVWWLALTVPLLKNVKQTHFLRPKKNVIRHSFRRLGFTFLKMKRNRSLLYFIIGYFFYIDGVYTIISMATSYGGEVGIDSTQMILALLISQFVAFPCAIASAKLAAKFGTLTIIKGYIICYSIICIFGYGLSSATEFWILAVAVGMCQGGIQALSRSYFGKLIPKKEASEYFGFFDIFGKFADFMGPLIISLCALLLGNSKYGVLSLIVLFIIGFILISKSEKIANTEEK